MAEGPADLGARVVLLAGPSGSGKSHLAEASGLPVLTLDDFYRDGEDPDLPREPELGIVDWDDPRAWDAGRAVATLETICRTGCADIPVYDIAADRATSTRRFCVDGATAFVAEGLFAAEIVGACRDRGILAEAIVHRWAPWKNFTRRLVRDLVERARGAAVLLRDPGFEWFLDHLTRPEPVRVAAPTPVETAIVLTVRIGLMGKSLLARLLDENGVVVVDLRPEHWTVAVDALVRHGKGRHPAALDFGDCLTDAIAWVMGEPLLCIGGGFSQTDLPLVPLR